MATGDFKPIHLSDLEYRSGSARSGNVRSTCPLCRDSRGHSKDPSLQVNLDSGFGHCFHCGENVQITERRDEWIKANRKFSHKEYKKPLMKEMRDLSSPEVLKYVRERGISTETMKALGVKECDRKFGDSFIRCLAFPFYDGGEIINCQYRSLDKKFQFEAGAEIIPWNVDAAIGETEIFVTEGMMDAAALYECGHRNVVSVGNGAGTSMETFDRFRFSHFDHLETIYIAGDTDNRGIELREALAKYFGEYRCKIVTWDYRGSSDGSGDFDAKDADECLMKGGSEAVEYCISHAAECPLSGIDKAGDVRDKLLGILKDGLPEAFGIGLKELDNMVRFQTSRLYVISGSPGAGKSTFADFIACCLLARYGWKVAMFSPEKFPSELHYMELIQKMIGKTFTQQEISQSMLDECIKFLDNNMFNIRADGDTTIGGILARAKCLVKAHGIKMLIIDPFNYIDMPPEPGSTETMKISQILKAIVDFMHSMDVAVILVAHPKKPQEKVVSETSVPSLYDINGSADFYNKCDVGIIMQRDEEKKVTFVHVLKVRFNMLGKIGKCAIKYIAESGRFCIAHQEKKVNGIGTYYVAINKMTRNWLPREDGIQAELWEEELPF